MQKDTIFTPRTIIGAFFYAYLMVLILFCSGCGARAEPGEDESPTVSESVEPTELPEVEAPATPSPVPDNPTFTMENPASYPVLNAITNNPTSIFSDERESLKIMEYGATGTSRDAFGHYQTEMTLEAGRQYSLLIHVHNGANGELGDDGRAENVHFTVNYPTTISGDASLSVLLTADNTIPMITGSSINLHADEELRLEFMDNTGELFPVKEYDYAMGNECKLAVVSMKDCGTGTISGNIGSLKPGYTSESGAYIYLWFRVEAVTSD